MKKIGIILIVILIGVSVVVTVQMKQKADVKELPIARFQDEDCKNTYTSACSMIAVDNLIDYIGRDDVKYVDIRNVSEAEEVVLDGFELISFLETIYNSDPEAKALYSGTINEPINNYENSDELLEKLLPKNRVIFLMCRSGSRVAQCMTLLSNKGYDMDLIYNIGGMNDYLRDTRYFDYMIRGKTFEKISLE